MRTTMPCLETFKQLVEGKKLIYRAQDTEKPPPPLDLVLDQLDKVSGISNLLYQETFDGNVAHVSIHASPHAGGGFFAHVIVSTKDQKMALLPPFLVAESREKITLEDEIKRFARFFPEFHLSGLPEQSLDTIHFETGTPLLRSAAKENGYFRGEFEVDVKRVPTKRLFRAWKDYFDKEIAPALTNEAGTTGHASKALTEFLFAIETNKPKDDQGWIGASVLQALASIQQNMRPAQRQVILREGPEQISIQSCWDPFWVVYDAIKLSKGTDRLTLDCPFVYE